MTALLRDPISLIELVVIVACLAFYAWWFSPRQRRTRQREQARNRALLRRVFTEPTEGIGEHASVPSVSHHDPCATGRARGQCSADAG